MIHDLALTLKDMLMRIKRCLNDPPYNYGFHLALAKEASDYYHWHLEVYRRNPTPPRLTVIDCIICRMKNSFGTLLVFLKNITQF
jgi:galactose-1-phosphate uridylyltransferase